MMMMVQIIGNDCNHNLVASTTYTNFQHLLASLLASAVETSFLIPP